MKKQIPGHIAGTFLIALTILFVPSCRKKGHEENATTPVTTVRPVGAPITDAIVETIGIEGGIVKSEDGRLEIKIPSGALTQDTDIGIQPVKNTSVSGIGYAYRLSPHGVIFKKKVTVLFRYQNDERRLSSKSALEIAFQSDKGVWTCTGGTVNDTLQKTVSVQTDHFSDWALIASMELIPVVKTVGLNEAVSLKAVRYVFPVTSDEDLVVPLTTPNASNGVPEKLDPKYIVKWMLNGPGKLESKGAETVYTSPSLKPGSNTATVTVELNFHGKQVLLISTIHIIDEGISISIDGGAWKTYQGMASTMPALNRYGLISIRSSLDIPQIVFHWPATAGQKSNGIYGWSALGEEENQVVFEYSAVDLQQIYASFYDDGQETYDSPGFISVEEKEEGGKKFVTGMFAVDKAGLVDANSGQQIKVCGIMGTFKVQRNW